ncbi:MAG: hypothetical protein U1B79_00910 [Candidatus Pacearchaeota archaeon]|nr:hypothetical protein [Nanoarchaeota archaeon]MDZ4226650.1 hypothetical protein [Candidatus Pacearchaeota archaeon]
MSEKNSESNLESILRDLGYRKYIKGESTDKTEELIHHWYTENGKLKLDYYIKRK